jgi:hypothetical protein
MMETLSQLALLVKMLGILTDKEALFTSSQDLEQHGLNKLGFLLVIILVIILGGLVLAFHYQAMEILWL